MTADPSPIGNGRTWLMDADALFCLGLDPPADEGLAPYELLEIIGEGGLGVVWKAQQTDPVRRLVALKLIKPGLQVRRDVVERFQQERRSLARMQHPNIAAIHDAGTLPDGRPFFVMELVEGTSLTEYCWSNNLSLRSRLQIFATLCDAVQHAHQKGILHRDLKPSNILVAKVDGRPEPKVIDFGIAKVLAQEEGDLDLLATRPGEMPSATYPYMSPEQALPGCDVDTRSDIYTLGVILHELLSGVLPVPAEMLQRGDCAAIARHIREADLPMASVSALAGGPAVEPRLLKGDVDAMVQYATWKEPGLRYASASALAEDVRRFLNDEPVLAKGPSSLYRARKWLKRHRVGVAVASTMFSTLAVALITSLTALEQKRLALEAEATQRSQAQRARAEALRRAGEAEAARAEENRARLQAENSRHVADAARTRAENLITDMLYDLRDSLEPLGRSALLDQVSVSAERYFDSIPEGQDNASQQRNRAAMHQNRGAILLAKGDIAAAKASFTKSLKLCDELARQDPNSVQRLHDLAIAHERVGLAEQQAGEYANARRHFEEMLRVFAHLRPEDDLRPQRWRDDICVAHERLGDLARASGDMQAAKASYTTGLEALKGTGGHQYQRRAALLRQRLGALAEADGDLRAASSHYEAETAALRQLLAQAADDQPLRASSAIASGRCCALAIRQKRYDATLAAAANQNLEVLLELTRLDPAIAAWQDALAVAHTHTAGFAELAHRDDLAETSYRAALEIMERRGTATADLPVAHLRLAACLLRRNKVASARDQAKLAHQALKTLGDSSEIVKLRATAAEFLADGLVRP